MQYYCEIAKGRIVIEEGRWEPGNGLSANWVPARVIAEREIKRCVDETAAELLTDLRDHPYFREVAEAVISAVANYAEATARTW